MLRGLYTSASGMHMQSLQQQILADNLANANTGGFKAAKIQTRSFEDQLIQSSDGELGTLSRGASIHNTSFDFQQGSLKRTGNPLDLALNGKGFFGVRNQLGDLSYTRAGNFSLDRNGHLITPNGDYVLNNGQSSISLGSKHDMGSITVQNNGDIYVGGNYVDSIGIFDFAPGVSVFKAEANRLKVQSSSGAASNIYSSNIQQGFLEESNVSPVRESTNLIEIMRSHEANQQMFRNQVDTLNMIMDVGRI